MKFSQNFIKTKRHLAKDIESVNAQILTRGGFIKLEVAGAYSYLPLGLLVLNKIENIIRRHLDQVATEIRMSQLTPPEYWQKTDRLETIDILMKAVGANKLSQFKSTNEYILACTHEDVVTPLVAEFVNSYKDLPVCLYQIGTKFRNEARAKSGLLRGREFRMKDLYSFHPSQKDFANFYDSMKAVYLNIFRDLGLDQDTYLTLASGGDFTKDYSHEFQVLLETGEDTIYLDRTNRIAYNKEIATEEHAAKLGVDFSQLEVVKASEIGNIFPLSTRFPDAFDFTYTDSQNQQQKIWMGSYGIGSTRLMGVLVEKFHDDKGAIWPEAVAPFKYHLLTDRENNQSDLANQIYQKYQGDILWDDRPDTQIGEKMQDADLIGCPVRLILSKRSLENGGLEQKLRNASTTEYLPV